MNTKSLIAILFLGSVSGCLPPSLTQGAEFRFQQLSLSNGLSNNTVQSIIQDSRGFMWFGTSDGLNKYDGYSFTTYRHIPGDSTSLSHSEILALYEDAVGDIWVGTSRGGLNRYERERDIFHTLPGFSREIGSMSVNAITGEGEGGLWFGTSDGLHLWNGQRFTHYRHSPDDPLSLSSNGVQVLLTDSSGRLWVGTNRGLNLFDRDTDCFKRYFIYEDAGTSESNGIQSIYQDSEGTLWIGTYDRGVIRMDPETLAIKEYLHQKGCLDCLSRNQVFTIAGDNTGHLYIGTENGGLNVLDTGTGAFTHYLFDLDDDNSISSNSIYSLCLGSDETLWLGTYNAGVNYTNTRAQDVRHVKAGTGRLNNPHILSIAEDSDENLWIGTDGGGLNFMNRKTGSFTYYQHDSQDPGSLSANSVTTVLVDRADMVWAGTYRGGLDLFDSGNQSFIHFRHVSGDESSLAHDFVQTLYETSAGELLVGLFSGLDHFDASKRTFRRTPYPIIESGVVSILEDHNGNLWIGTYGGLSFVDRKADTVMNYIHGFTKTHGEIPRIAHALLEDDRGELWVGASEGLYRFEAEESKFVRFRIGEEQENRDITGVIRDGAGGYWLSTSSSIIRMLVTAAKQEPTFQDFGVYDGLNGLFQTRSGEIFFGGNHGLNSFFPRRIVKNNYVPPVVLTSFRLFNREINPDSNSPLRNNISEAEKILLSHDQDVISFDFAALNYIHPEKNQYAYIMEGFEDDWNYVGNKRSATYTNLDPGSYVFRVKASNNDGVWNEKGARIAIVIVPPWWKTGWAFSFYVVALGLLWHTIWRFQLNRARMRQELLLEHQHAERLEEINRMKTRFFTNLTHEFRTPLTLIMGPIKQMIASRPGKKFGNELQMILRHSQTLYQLINQLLDLSKLEAGHLPLRAEKDDVVPFLRELVSLFQPYAARKDIDLSLEVEPSSVQLYYDRDKLQKIVTNLLSNAVKFTSEKGMVSVRMICHDSSRDSAFPEGYVEIIVEDNGIGCPRESIDRIFDRFYEADEAYLHQYAGTGIGLALTKELVEAHYGTIHVESEYGKGSTFVVRLPTGSSHLAPEEKVREIVAQKTQELDESVVDSVQTEEEAHDPENTDRKPLVLIIEDNSDLRRYVCRRLESDFQILPASSGVEGLKLAFDSIPDLVISDIVMSGMDGLEFCSRVKNDERTCHVPVILLTAKSAPESKIEGLKSGADDYIVKPFEVDELLVRARNLIEQRRKLRLQFSRNKGLSLQEVAATSLDEEFLRKALAIIEQHIDDPEFDVEGFSQSVSLSRVQLHRKLKALTGQSASEFVRAVRLNRAAQLLSKQTNTITQIAFAVGFNSSSYFSRAFYKHFGMSPSEYAVRTRNGEPL